MKWITDATRDIGIAGLAFVLFWYFSTSYIFLVIGGFYMALCFAVPQVKLSNNQFWTKLSIYMQLIFQPMLFGIIFIALVLPLGLLFRIFKKRKTFSKSSFQEVDSTSIDPFFQVPW